MFVTTAASSQNALRSPRLVFRPESQSIAVRIGNQVKLMSSAHDVLCTIARHCRHLPHPEKSGGIARNTSEMGKWMS